MSKVSGSDSSNPKNIMRHYIRNYMQHNEDTEEPLEAIEKNEVKNEEKGDESVLVVGEAKQASKRLHKLKMGPITKTITDEHFDELSEDDDDKDKSKVISVFEESDTPPEKEKKMKEHKRVSFATIVENNDNAYQEDEQSWSGDQDVSVKKKGRQFVLSSERGRGRGRGRGGGRGRGRGRSQMIKKEVTERKKPGPKSKKITVIEQADRDIHHSVQKPSAFRPTILKKHVEVVPAHELQLSHATVTESQVSSVTSVPQTQQAKRHSKSPIEILQIRRKSGKVQYLTETKGQIQWLKKSDLLTDNAEELVDFYEERMLSQYQRYNAHNLDQTLLVKED